MGYGLSALFLGAFVIRVEAVIAIGFYVLVTLYFLAYKLAVFVKNRIKP